MQVSETSRLPALFVLLYLIAGHLFRYFLKEKKKENRCSWDVENHWEKAKNLLKTLKTSNPQGQA